MVDLDEIKRSDNSLAGVVDGANNEVLDTKLVTYGKDFFVGEPFDIEDFGVIEGRKFGAVGRRSEHDKCEDVLLTDVVPELTDAGQLDIAAGFFFYFPGRSLEKGFAGLEMTGWEAPLSAAFLFPLLDEEVFAVFLDQSADDDGGLSRFKGRLRGGLRGGLSGGLGIFHNYIFLSVRVLSFSWTAAVSVRRVWRRQSMSVWAIFRVRFRTGSSARGSKKS